MRRTPPPVYPIFRPAMKLTRLPLALLTLALFIVGCATYPGTTSLWIGMTRAQAIRAMGPPESVSAQGEFEYLNYTLPVNGGGYTVSRPYYVRISHDAVESFGYSGQLTAAARPSAPPAKRDSIRVLSVEPTRLRLDQMNRLTVKLAYVVQSPSGATISLSFNTKTPGMQLTLATKTIPPGSGEIEIPVEVTPVAWPNRSDVKLLASLYPAPLVNGAQSLDFAGWDLPATK